MVGKMTQGVQYASADIAGRVSGTHPEGNREGDCADRDPRPTSERHRR